MVEAPLSHCLSRQMLALRSQHGVMGSNPTEPQGVLVGSGIRAKSHSTPCVPDLPEGSSRDVSVNRFFPQEHVGCSILVQTLIVR